MNIKMFFWMTMAIGAGSAFAEGIALRPSTALLQTGTTSATPGAAAAMTGSNATSQATSSSQGGAAQGVGSQGQSLSIDSHAVYQSAERNPVSSAIAPALAGSNDTCMGSSSLGGSAVTFSFSVGSTWVDQNCVMLKNAREMWNMGFKGAALARLCMDSLNKESLEATGIKCPQRGGAVASIGAGTPAAKETTAWLQQTPATTANTTNVNTDTFDPYVY
jgi:hypothetical protein